MEKVKFYSNQAKTLQVYPELDMSEQLELSISNYFNSSIDDGIYGVSWDLWETSHSSNCTKYGSNASQTITPATDVVAGSSTYGAAFNTYDCNAFVDDDGIPHVTYLKGTPGYGDTEETILPYKYNDKTYIQDVFVLKRTYYEKWYSDGTKQYYERSYIPREGFTVVPQAINKDGSIREWFLVAKYVTGLDSQNRYRSLKGLKPIRNISYNNAVTSYKERGDYYSAGLASEYKDLATTFWLKYGTRDMQSIMTGCSYYNYQYVAQQTENDTTRVKILTTEANNLAVGSCVSVGDIGSATSLDRGNAYIHNLADNVEILSIEEDESDNTYSYVNLDCEPFDITTASTTYISTMLWKSGFSDKVLGRDGCPGNLTNNKYPIVIDGIECFVGGNEVIGNAFMDIANDANIRNVYVTNDATKITNNITTAKANYTMSTYSINTVNTNNWNWITEVQLDLNTGILVPTQSGDEQASSTNGFADAVYIDNAISGQREFLVLGSLYNGGHNGNTYCVASNALTGVYWAYVSRLSIGALKDRQ